MIYGKKNFLYPVKLEIGFGLLFKIDESCLANHVGERVSKEEFNEDLLENLPLLKQISREESISSLQDSTNVEVSTIEINLEAGKKT